MGDKTHAKAPTESVEPTPAPAPTTRQPEQDLIGNQAILDQIRVGAVPEGASEWSEPDFMRCLTESAAQILGNPAKTAPGLPEGATLPPEPDLLGNLKESAANFFIDNIVESISETLGPGEGGLASGMRPDRPGYKPVPEAKSAPEQLFNTALGVPMISGPRRAVRGMKDLSEVPGLARKWTDTGGRETAEAFKRAEFGGKPRTALSRSYDTHRRPKDLGSVRDEVVARDKMVNRGEGKPLHESLAEYGKLDQSIDDAYSFRPNAKHGVIGTDRMDEFWEGEEKLRKQVGEVSSIEYNGAQELPLWYPGSNFAWVRGMADRGTTVHHLTPDVPMFRTEPGVGRVPTFTNEEARYLYEMGYTNRGNVLSPPPRWGELPGDISKLHGAGPVAGEAARYHRRVTQGTDEEKP